MAGRLEGKVALITGAAMGQGKSHCIRLAEEGAAIIATDLCAQIDSVRYPLGSDADLADTVAKVEAVGGRIVAVKADVRERNEMRDAVAQGLAAFGRLDIVCCNAGILPVKDREVQAFIDAVDVDFGGVLNTIAVTMEHLGAGASIVLTGSTAGMMPGAVNNPQLGPGGTGYGLSKKMILDYTESLALQVATRMIRVNAIHPTNTNTNLLHNADIYGVFRPDLSAPTLDDVLPVFNMFQAMPIPFVEPRDISNLVLFLASDESRYMTGLNIRIDAGAFIKSPGIPG